MRVAYFVHDLNDAAVARRVVMLASAGIEAVVCGFWRGEAPPATIGGAACMPLARSFDARFAHRAFVTLKNVLGASGLLARLGKIDLVIARNLEMLAIGTAVSAKAGGLPLVYEALDIHRLLLSPGIEGRVLRALERLLMRRTSLLITSSPAFLREYYEPIQFATARIPTLLVENKVFLPACRDPGPQVIPEPPPGPPWRIGWLGMLRCRRSFEFLRALAARRPDLVRIEIHGKPSDDVFADFEEEVSSTPAVHFGGAYTPAQLDRLYRGMHFNWAVDYFEESGNSEWLLPNRIYEGGLSDTVPLALRRNEIGRWLARHGLGVLMDDPMSQLEAFLDGLTGESYARLKAASRNMPRSAFIAGQADCDRLGSALAAAAYRKSASVGSRLQPIQHAGAVPRGEWR